MAEEIDERQRHGISRRTFLRGSGAIAATASLTAAGVACESSTPDAGDQGVATYRKTAEDFYDGTAAPVPADGLTGYQFFTPSEAKTAEALFARILPGTPEDPGAREAGVLLFVDYKLGTNDGFAEPTYRDGPFAASYEGSAPPEAAGPGAKAIYIAKDQLDRYGFQSVMTPRETYRSGLGALDRYATAKFGKAFVDLAEGDQDAIVTDLAKGKTSGPAAFTSPSDKAFFKAVRADVVQGMFADPAYGGNQGKAGWKLIRYPGAQRAYSPEDMSSEAVREPQSMAELHASEPGTSEGPNTINPVSAGTPGQYDAHRAH